MTEQVTPRTAVIEYLNTVNAVDSWQPPLTVLIGLGMGRADLSSRALDWIGRAEILAGGKRQLGFFPNHPGRKVVLRSPLNISLEQLASLSQDYRTVILASGDPLFFGIGRRLQKYFSRERLLILPNITTVQALFARLGEPWEDVATLSLHGRANQGDSWLREVRNHARLAIFTDSHHAPDKIAQKLLDYGISGRRLVVAEDMGQPSEKIQSLSLLEASRRSFSGLNLVAVLPNLEGGPMDSGKGLPGFGIADDCFRHQAGLITKMEVRAVVLAHLQLTTGLVLWDLGAGSGSIAIEAARLIPLRRVCAVEKHGARYQDLMENVHRFQCGEIQAVHGNALEVMDDLPDPDRVFVGGSGGDPRAILEQVVWRLRPGGRVVQTAVTMETLEAVRAFWQDKAYAMAVTQLQINRSVPIQGASRLEALNPVFVISAWRDD